MLATKVYREQAPGSNKKLPALRGRQTDPCSWPLRPGSLLSAVGWGLSVERREGNPREGHLRRMRPWGAF